MPHPRARSNALRDLALAKLAGFRHKTVTVAEWGGEKVVLREPSAEAWLRWQDIVKGDNELSETVSEKALRTLRADVVLFMDVLCDITEQPVFSHEDAQEVATVYGPVHSRLLKQALDLILTEEAEKK